MTSRDIEDEEEESTTKEDGEFVFIGYWQFSYFSLIL